uniref:Rab3-GAP regulatory subunit N-terminal domain-containing protein n=1 Tax=Schistocephalus solidus TaxID=70667 RepID=A0A0V0J3L6_SCHSO
MLLITNREIAFQIEKSPVLALRCTRFCESLIVLFSSCVVLIEADSLYTAFSAFVSGLENSCFDFHISVHRSKNKERFCDVCLIAKTARFYDISLENALLSSPDTEVHYSRDVRHFALAGKDPFIAFFDGILRKSLWKVPEGLHFLKDRAKDIVSSFGVPVRPHWKETNEGIRYVWPGRPNFMLIKTHSLADQARIAIPDGFAVSVDGRLGTITDNNARVTLLDLHRGVALRFWKGYRDAQTRFIEASEHCPPAGRPARRGRFLLLYSPRSSILELWSLVHGPLLKCWNLTCPLRFLPLHYQTFGRTLRKYNIVFLLNETHLYGLRTKLDLQFQYTDEASDSHKFCRLRSFISSRKFKKSLTKDLLPTASILSSLLRELSTADWFFKSVWTILRSSNSTYSLLNWLKNCLEDSSSDSICSRFSGRKDYAAFLVHLSLICRLINLFSCLVDLLGHRSNNYSSGIKIEKESSFTTSTCVEAQTEKAVCSSAFFRAAAFSRLFRVQFPVSFNSSADMPELTASAFSSDKVRAHEIWLGNFIFMPYLRGFCDCKILLNILDESFQSAEYSLILLTYCILSLQPSVNRDDLVDRIDDLLDPLLTKYLIQMAHSHGLFLHPDFLAILTSRRTFGALVFSKVYHRVLQRLEQSDILPTSVILTRQDLITHWSLVSTCLDQICLFHSFLDSFFDRYSVSRKGFYSSGRSALPFEIAVRWGTDYYNSAFAKAIIACGLSVEQVVQLYRSFCTQEPLPPTSSELPHDQTLEFRFSLIFDRVPQSLELNRVLICVAWLLYCSVQFRLATPAHVSPKDYTVLENLSDFLAHVSRASHPLAFRVAWDCWEKVACRLLGEHFNACPSMYFVFRDSTSIGALTPLLEQGLALYQFLSVLRRLHLSADEVVPVIQASDSDTTSRLTHYWDSVLSERRSIRCAKKIREFALGLAVTLFHTGHAPPTPCSQFSHPFLRIPFWPQYRQQIGPLFTDPIETIGFVQSSDSALLVQCRSVYCQCNSL